MAGLIIPPGGFAGMSQMTPASRAAWGSAGRSTTKRRRKSKSAKKRTTKRRASSSRKPKFGTPAFRKKYGNGKRKKSKR